MSKETAFKYLCAYIRKHEYSDFLSLAEQLFGLLIDTGFYEPEDLLERYMDYLVRKSDDKQHIGATNRIVGEE